MKDKLVGLFAALVIFGLVQACDKTSTGSGTEEAGVADPGKEIYETNCSICHGPTGEGDGPAGVNLKPRPRNYVSDGFKYGSRIEEIVLTIRDGLEDTDMPAWKDSLSDEEILHVAKYVRFLASRKAN